MQFNTLEELSIPEITNLFNDAFADYFVKIELTPDFMQGKINSEAIQLDKSVGIFTEGKPVAFILHAERNNVVYNAGTGVLPEFRGQHATIKMYNYILPKLKKEGVSKIVLEVIDENVQAIKSYEKVGFNKDRNLPGFKGRPLNLTGNTSIKIAKIENVDFKLLQSFWEWEPTWQHSIATLKKLADYKIYGAFFNEELVAYLYANASMGRVAQFAVKPEFRKQGIGTTLFQHFSEVYSDEISVFNTDGNYPGTHSFLQKLGLKHILTQHKMILNLNSK